MQRCESKLSSLDRRVGVLELAAEASIDFDRPYLEELVCKDEIDVAILQVLFEAGSPGLLPKDIAQKLSGFEIKRHQVSRRLLHMNTRLQKKHKTKCLLSSGAGTGHLQALLPTVGDLAKKR